MPGAELLAGLPADVRGDVRVADLMGVSSNAVTPEDMLTIARAVEAAQDDPRIDSVVVTHGTATLEETVFFVHLVVPHRKPVVFTGAQRAPGAPGYDGARNLGDAISAARTGQLSGAGPVLILDGRIYCARDVMEVSSTSTGGFASPEFGALGSVQDGRVQLARVPRGDETIEGVRPPLARVEIVRCYAGMGDFQVLSELDSGAQGLIIEGLTSGALPPSILNAVRACTEAGMVVVVTSRCVAGQTVRPDTDQVDIIGYGSDVLELGVAMTDLSGLKARCKLILLLSCGMSADAVRAAMDTAEG
jgi:L-asparaginase